MKKFLIQFALEIILLISLFFDVFVSKNISTTFGLVAIALFLILAFVLNGYKKPVARERNDAIFVIVGLCMVLLGAFYMVGYKTGFATSYSQIFKKYITAFTWIKVFLIVILSEITRYVLTLRKENKKIRKFTLQGLMLINFVLLDLVIATKSYDFTNFNQLYEFIALVLLQSISKNIFLNYASARYGYVPCLIYRFMIDLYFYFLPITPSINVFIEGVILLVFPYIVYMFLRTVLERQAPGPAKTKREKDGPLTYLAFIVFGVLVALVSREFSYAMIAIGSGSMTGTINKGDAVIYEVVKTDKMNESNKLRNGDILVFQKNNITVVHRIIEVKSINGTDVYQTKGDANPSKDNWLVYPNEVIGRVKLRVPIIAWPSVILSEWF